MTLSLEEVARRLDGEGIPWALFAGAAAQVYGSARPVTDIDILVPSAEESRLVALFPEAETRRYDHGPLALIMPGFDILAGLAVIDLDEAMEARIEHGQVEGVRVPVIPREDNILLKTLWGRGAEEGKHDWKDVVAMLAAAETLDWDYLRWRAGRLPDQGRAAQALAKLDELAQRRM